MNKTTVNPIHSICEACGALLHHDPALISHDTGIGGHAPPIAHTADRCAALVGWAAWVASRRPAA